MGKDYAYLPWRRWLAYLWVAVRFCRGQGLLSPQCPPQPNSLNYFMCLSLQVSGFVFLAVGLRQKSRFLQMTRHRQWFTWRFAINYCATLRILFFLKLFADDSRRSECKYIFSTPTVPLPFSLILVENSEVKKLLVICYLKYTCKSKTFPLCCHQMIEKIISSLFLGNTTSIN